MANETSLKKEIEELRNHIYNLERRTDAIEENIGIKEPLPEIHITQPKEQEEEEKPEPEEEKAPKRKDTTFEQDIGTKWFGKVGTIALVMGIAYFIKYAFDNNWISHTARIILGTLTGIIIIIIGQLARTNKPYARWGDTLTGGGFAITYFCIYAAYHFDAYRIATGISQTLDIILLSVVVLAAIITSLRNDSQIIAAESFLLGYTTSYLSLSFDILTLVYGLLLTIGLVVTVTKKGWTTIGILGIIATYWLHINWYTDNSNQFMTSSIFLISYFLLYTAQTLMINADSKKTSINIIAALNSILFFALFFIGISDHHRAYESLFTVMLSLASAATYFISSSLNKENIKNTYIYLSLFYFTFAIPIQFDGYWISLLWSIELIALTVIAISSKSPSFRNISYALPVIIFLRLISIDTLKLESYDPANILNSERLIAYISVIIAYYSLSVYTRDKKFLPDAETVSDTYAWAASFLSGLIVLIEMDSYWVSLIWSLEMIALIIAGTGFDIPPMRKSGKILAVLTTARLFLYDSIALEPYNPTDILKSERLIAYISVISAHYIISGYLWLAEKKTGTTKPKEIYSWAGSALAVIIILIEMKTYWISVGWTLLAMCLLTIGLIAQRKELRTQGILILLLTILKVFLHDTTELSPIYRTISFIVLGIILISISFLYTRYREKIKEII